MAKPRSEKAKRVREYDWEAVEPTVAIFESISEFDNEWNSETAPSPDLPLDTYVDTDTHTTLFQSERPC